MSEDDHKTSVYGRDLPISTKHAVEICNFIKGKSLQESKRMLENVMKKKIAVPFKRFNRNVGHKPGRMAAGRYPYMASSMVLDLLASLEANAQNKGLDTNTLYLTSLIPNKASRPMHFGRQRRRKMKRTHIRIIAEEKKAEKKVQQKAPPQQKQKAQQGAAAK